MGLDGFAMSNLGINRDMTSVQMVSQVEQIAAKETEHKIKDVTDSAEKQGIKNKEGEGGNGGGSSFGGQKEQEEDLEEQEDVNEIDFENKNPKDFSVRINPDTEMVELFNNKNKRVMESINANDLMVLISKLSNSSGVIVNKKI